MLSDNTIEELIRSTIKECLTDAFSSALRSQQATHHAPMGASKQEVLLSRKEAAALLNVSVQTISSLVKSGKLSVVKISRRVLITRESFIELTRNNEVTQ